MELTISKQPVSINEMLYDGVTEQPLECDVLLPDYCPDIQKILRCEVGLSLLSWGAQGERLTLDGVACAHLYYLDEESILRQAEYKIPYTKAVDLRGTAVDPVVEITQTADYFNCRAVNARRLDMHGAVKIVCKVMGQAEEEVVCGAQGMGIQLRHETVETVRLLPCPLRLVELREEVELTYGKPSVGEILRTAASVRVTDYKVISGKIISKAEAIIHILYRCEEDASRLETMEYTLPVSQVIDLDGIDEGCTCALSYEVCGADAQPKRGMDGESRTIALHVSMNAVAHAAKPIVIETAGDCYSTEYESRQLQKQIPVLEQLGQVSESVSVKEPIKAEKIKGMIDLWGIPGNVSSRVEADEAVISGRVTFCMFAYDEEDKIFYHEQLCEFTKKLALPKTCGNLLFTPRAGLESVSFAMEAGQPEARCLLSVSGELYNRCSRQVICAIETDESRKKNRRENMLYLYYAAGKESLWEIAKRYNTSVEAIQKGNALDGSGIGGRTMLLIPMK